MVAGEAETNLNRSLKVEVQYWEMAKFVAVPLAVIVTQKMFDFKNAKAHDDIIVTVKALADDLKKVVDHFELDVENGEYITQMGEVKAYYVSQLKDKSFRLAANKKTNVFIGMVEKTIQDHPEMGPQSWTQVMQDFDTGFGEVKRIMAAHIGDHAETFYVQHGLAYDIYKAEIQSIFVGLSNARKERFIKLSNQFMIQYLTAFVQYEKDYA